MINLHAFASPYNFTQNISQDFSTSAGNDIVTLKGSKFAVELIGVTSANALTASNFTF